MNREAQDSHIILLTVTDRGTNPTALSSSTICTVTVLDINDNDPVITAPVGVTLMEDTSLNTIISTIVATDLDIDANARISYEIDSGNTMGSFYIDSDSGIIYYSASICTLTLVNDADKTYTWLVHNWIYL